jgi:2-haloacid dehalogenase
VIAFDVNETLKPRREPYEMAARTFAVPTADVMFVAAHAWDLAGAMAAGCRAAFVARPNMPRNPIDPEPDIAGTDLGEIANRILAG